MRLVHHALLIPMLFGCGSKQAAPPSEPAPPTEPATSNAAAPFDVGDLKFAWPAPGRVVIVEDAQKKGKRAKTRYALVIEPVGEGLHVSYADFEFLELPGVDLADPANAAQLAQVTALTSAIPTLEISKHGELTGFIDFDGMLQKTQEFVLGTVPPEQHDLWKAIFASEDLRENIEETSAAPWRAWVELWTRDDLPAAGEAAEYEADDGTQFEFENHGLQPDGSLRLVMRTSETGPLDEMAPVLRDLGVDLTKLTHDATVHVEFWVETTRTMQPRRAYYETRSEVAADDGEKKTYVESHHYTFTW